MIPRLIPIRAAWQPKMSRELALHGRLVNAIPVIPDAQAKVPFVVPNLHRDPPCLGVAEGVA
jgi:hypothetical protein